MLKIKKGCIVPSPEKLHEQYEILEDRVIANIGTDKILSILKDFIAMHNEPLFFILEIPTNAKDETDEDIKNKAYHNDVYYVDGCSHIKANEILNNYGSLLIDDGLNCFGFGGHNSNDEILFGKYNNLIMFGKDKEQFAELLEKYEIERVDNLVTAWETFSHGGKHFLMKISDDVKL